MAVTAVETLWLCNSYHLLDCFFFFFKQKTAYEIPSSIVRWHGRKRTERFLGRLCRAAKEEDPGALVTYVNFPSTEYLSLPSFDFMSFNVYLEHQPLLERYLARLQNLADDRPLVL